MVLVHSPKPAWLSSVQLSPPPPFKDTRCSLKHFNHTRTLDRAARADKEQHPASADTPSLWQPGAVRPVPVSPANRSSQLLFQELYLRLTGVFVQQLRVSEADGSHHHTFTAAGNASVNCLKYLQMCCLEV